MALAVKVASASSPHGCFRRCLTLKPLRPAVCYLMPMSPMAYRQQRKSNPNLTVRTFNGPSGAIQMGHFCVRTYEETLP